MENALSKIKDQLAKRKADITGWQIRESQKTSFQSFLAKEEPESRRAVHTISYWISIYQKRRSSNSAETLGLSTFKVTPVDFSQLEKRLDDAVFAAKLVSNQPFELPEQPSTIPQVAIADPTLNETTLNELENRLKAAVAREKGIRLSSAEFFIDQIETRLLNHKGLDVRQKGTTIETEFILLCRSDAKENEYIERYERRYRKDFELEQQVAKSAQFAREATVAVLPKTGAFPVLLSEEPLDRLFEPLVARASARLKYNKMNNSTMGASILDGGEAKGDQVTLWLNNTLDRAPGSFLFDSYGTPAQRVCLIEKNRLKNFLADKRYADYLSLPVTGEMGNLEVEPGSKSFDELKASVAAGKPLYHILAFSAFEPNSITGAFSAEIRTGYEISRAGVRPIKGGSVTGVLQKDLLDAHLSKERIQREHVFVPKGILFQNLTIAGDKS